MEFYGYNCVTTFWEDFSIADRFGIEAVRNTFKRAFEEWKNDVKYVTELVMVLNHKIWQWYATDEPMARVYNDLWLQADTWCQQHLEGNDLAYYYRTLD